MSKHLIFGSTAMKHWFPDLRDKPKDLDIMGQGKSSPGVEYHWNEAFQYVLENNKDEKYVDPDFLYTIKVSHAEWNIRWSKTIIDIKNMKKKGCMLDPLLYNMLHKEWEKIHIPKRVVISGYVEEFFRENITRKFDHEELHERIKYNEIPMHYKIRKNPEKVNVSKELWDKLSYMEQLQTASEEVIVFAVERHASKPPKHSLFKALEDLITKSCTGFFALFMIMNFEEILELSMTNQQFINLKKEIKDDKE